MKTSCGKFLNLTHYFPYDVKLRLLAHSRSFLANQKARNTIVRAENLLKDGNFTRSQGPVHMPRNSPRPEAYCEVNCEVKEGVNQKVVFWLGIMFLMQISRLRFKQSRISMLISHIYVLGCFVNFLVIFWYIWREIVFLKGLVKLMEIGNFEDLLLF